MAELITPTAEREHLGGGVYRTTVHLAPVAYADAGGVLRRIANDWSDGDGTYPHVVSAARMRVRTAPNGDRLLLPVPGDDEAWFSISSPFINNGTNWIQPSLGSFSRTGNQLTATAANVITRINHAGHYIKAEYELLNGWTPQNGQFAYRVGLNGLTRDGGTLLYNGVPVMLLRKPVAYDAGNESDVREITHDFVQFGGQNYILFTLPSLAGMSRPVVDPTFTAQPDAAAGKDTQIYSEATSVNKGYGTNTLVRVGRTASGDKLRSMVQFDISALPAGATINSATLTLYCESEGSTTDYNVAAHRALTQWYEPSVDSITPVGDGSVWNYRNYNGTVAWSGGAGGGSGSDYAASATDTVSITGTGTTFDWTVTADVSAWHAGTATNYGWWLIGNEATAADTFKRLVSSDHATAGNRPQLVVEYTLPNPGTTNLVSYWPLNETSGTRADSHGSNDLTDYNTVGNTTGVQSNAAAFVSANNEGLYRADASNVFAPADWTISCWVRGTSISGLETIANKSAVTATSGQSWILRFSSSPTAIEAVVYVSNAAYTAKWGSAPSTATWYHVAAWYDSTAGTVGVSVDGGAAITTSTGGGATDQEGSQFSIGISTNNNTTPTFYRPLDGDIDEFSFWSRVLNAAERAWLYNAGTGRTYAELAASGGTTIPVVMHHRRTQGMS